MPFQRAFANQLRFTMRNRNSLERKTRCFERDWRKNCARPIWSHRIVGVLKFFSHFDLFGCKVLYAVDLQNLQPIRSNWEYKFHWIGLFTLFHECALPDDNITYRAECGECQSGSEIAKVSHVAEKSARLFCEQPVCIKSHKDNSKRLIKRKEKTHFAIYSMHFAANLRRFQLRNFREWFVLLIDRIVFIAEFWLFRFGRFSWRWCAHALADSSEEESLFTVFSISREQYNYYTGKENPRKQTREVGVIISPIACQNKSLQISKSAQNNFIVLHK